MSEDIIYIEEVKLRDQIGNINDMDIKKFVSKVLDNAPKDFWVDPCSGSGKYHPPEDQGDGGIIRHLIKCGEISYELSRFYDISERDRDIVVASSLIHDIRKNGLPWGNKTDHEHGLIAYHWLDQFQLKQPEKNKIKDCVRYHMARWVQPEDELERALNPTTNELIVQLTDYFCSRQCASFLPGVDVGERTIECYFEDV